MVTKTKPAKKTSKPRKARASANGKSAKDSPEQTFITPDMAPEKLEDLEDLGNEHKDIVRQRKELADRIDPLMEKAGELLHENDLRLYQCQESRAIFTIETGEQVKVSYPKGRKPKGEE